MRSPLTALAISLFALSTLAPATAQTVPSGFVIDTLVSTGLNGPNDFTFLPDGRILIANYAGAITVWANGPTASIGSVPSVETGSERALLSIVADPGFATNGYIYVWYASTADTFLKLDRFTLAGDLTIGSSTNLTLQATTRRVVLGSITDSAFNHNGGSLRFGPDGMLYVSFGDDASNCPAQTLTDPRGKLLRLDVSGLPAGGSTVAPAFTAIGPSTNPLGTATDFSRLVIGHGLRNPVRMTIDPNTGNCYIGDVGQSAREEYSEYVYNTGGLQLVNFGWPWLEGNANFTTCVGTIPPGLTPPLVDVPRAQSWISIMGGPRYRNRGGQWDFGPGYEGNAFYNDYYAGELRMLTRSSGAWAPAPAVPGQPNATNWGTGFTGLVSYDVGPDGAIYMVKHTTSGSQTGGSLLRLRPLGPVNSVAAVSGAGQAGVATEAFAQPLVFQVNNPQGQPLAGGTVNFSTIGSATLSTTNPVIADATGRVQTLVTAGPLGGLIRVTATTPGGLVAGTTADLFARRTAITRAGGIMVVQVQNTTTAPTPVQVPMLLMCSIPGINPLQTAFGPVCTNPYDPWTFPIEDSIGVYAFYSLSGTGAIGTPGLTKLYNIPTGALVGTTLWFQSIGLDPVAGLWRTNCELKTL
jgi:glucose/arabinose dehydrogenase